MRSTIPRTERIDWPRSTFARNHDAERDVTLTAWLRAKKNGALDAERAAALGLTVPAARTYEDRSDLHQRTGADDADVELLETYCGRYGIKLLEKHWRSAVISGPLDRLVEAFGATVAVFQADDGAHFRHRSKGLSADDDVAKVLRGVFGYHQWPKSHRLGPLQRHATPLSAKEITARYAFPAGDGTGQTIAILQMRGEFRAGDFDRCMKAQHVAPSVPVLKRVDDAALTHEIQTTKDVEAALDSQIIAQLAPGARIVVYEAPDDERGFLDAIRTAIFDVEQKPAILSISYGWPEFLWTPAAVDILNELFIAAALLGISVFCASGDNGAELDYDGKPHVLAPASSPFVHACGATEIDPAAPEHETAWKQSGGGFSERFESPAWQIRASGRGVPDVAAQQQPGYYVVLDGVELAAGGTSAIAPLWSALTARLNQQLGHAAGFFAPLLYRHPQTFRHDGARWNAHTGLGVPVGTEIEAALRG